MTVITISRQFGSGGDEIANRLCLSLGYRMFDKNHLFQAAAEAGISEKEIVDYSEENYKVKSFFERLFVRARPLAQMSYTAAVTDGITLMEPFVLDEVRAVELVRHAIEAAYQKGNMVILGRGGQVILASQPDVLKIRIEAPLEDRIQRVKVSHHLARREAQDLIEERDAASREYLKHFYNIDWSDPLLYHLVLNTGKLNLELATNLICTLVHSRERLETAAIP